MVKYLFTKMKTQTETQIAEENIRNIKKLELPEMNQANISGMIIEHKASCQRFLEFLELEIKNIFDIKNQFFKADIDRKINDLKQAIKLYEDNGI